jgi:hypothetical protein
MRAWAETGLPSPVPGRCGSGRVSAYQSGFHLVSILRLNRSDMYMCDAVSFF